MTDHNEPTDDEIARIVSAAEGWAAMNAPIPKSDMALMIVSELGTYRELLFADGLNRTGLGVVRMRLRENDTEAKLAPFGKNLVELRRIVLDGVSRALAGDNEADLARYEMLGDVTPIAPDDISELDDEDDGSA